MALERRSALAVFAVLGGGAALTGAVLWWWNGADPSTELVVQLKDVERVGVELAIPGEATAAFGRINYDRLSIELQPGAAEAAITATLDFDGNLADVQIRSLGFERVPFVRAGRKWTTPRGPAPLLAGALQALAARRRALAAGDLPALAGLAKLTHEAAGADPALGRYLNLSERRYEVRAWYLRLERDSALVTEEYRVTGSTSERPIDEEGSRRLELRLGERGEFYFARGLM